MKISLLILLLYLSVIILGIFYNQIIPKKSIKSQYVRKPDTRDQLDQYLDLVNPFGYEICRNDDFRKKLVDLIHKKYNYDVKGA